MATGVPYTVVDIYNSLCDIYDITKDLFKGGMSKRGYMTEIVARECRKRGILYFNGARRRPEWKWVASLPPTKELSRNIFKILTEKNEKRRITGNTKAEVTPSPAIEQPGIELKNTNQKHSDRLSGAAIQNIPNTPAYEGTVVSRVHLSPELIEKLGDKFLVAILRQRGYTVTCKKNN